MYYRQCKLVKYIWNYNPKSMWDITYQVAFIPETFAKVGQKLKIKEGEYWDTGWEVEEVSSTRTDEKHLPDSHKEIKSHRKSTGDNTPKVKNTEE